jgi:hypothetical protein
MTMNLGNGVRHGSSNGFTVPSANGAGGGRPGDGAPMANGANGEHPETDRPSANGANGRDERGRFTRGNLGGPGNPFARRVAVFRRAICQAVSEDNIRAVTGRLVQQARAGDVAAARVLLAYAVGRPADVVDPDNLDVKEWQLYRQTPVRPEEVLAIVQGLKVMPVDVACLLVRTALPFLSEAAGRLTFETLTGKNEPTAEAQPDGDRAGSRAKGRRRKAKSAAADRQQPEANGEQQ